MNALGAYSLAAPFLPGGDRGPFKALFWASIVVLGLTLAFELFLRIRASEVGGDAYKHYKESVLGRIALNVLGCGVVISVCHWNAVDLRKNEPIEPNVAWGRFGFGVAILIFLQCAMMGYLQFRRYMDERTGHASDDGSDETFLFPASVCTIFLGVATAVGAGLEISGNDHGAWHGFAAAVGLLSWASVELIGLGGLRNAKKRSRRRSRSRRPRFGNEWMRLATSAYWYKGLGEAGAAVFMVLGLAIRSDLCQVVALVTAAACIVVGVFAGAVHFFYKTLNFREHSERRAHRSMRPMGGAV